MRAFLRVRCMCVFFQRLASSSSLRRVLPSSTVTDTTTSHSQSGFSYWAALIFVLGREERPCSCSGYPHSCSAPLPEFPWTSSWKETIPNALAQTIVNLKQKMKLQVTDYSVSIIQMAILLNILVMKSSRISSSCFFFLIQGVKTLQPSPLISASPVILSQVTKDTSDVKGNLAVTFYSTLIFFLLYLLPSDVISSLIGPTMQMVKTPTT